MQTVTYQVCVHIVFQKMFNPYYEVYVCLGLTGPKHQPKFMVLHCQPQFCLIGT